MVAVYNVVGSGGAFIERREQTYQTEEFNIADNNACCHCGAHAKSPNVTYENASRISVVIEECKGAAKKRCKDRKSIARWILHGSDENQERGDDNYLTALQTVVTSRHIDGISSSSDAQRDQD